MNIRERQQGSYPQPHQDERGTPRTDRYYKGNPRTYSWSGTETRLEENEKGKIFVIDFVGAILGICIVITYILVLIEIEGSLVSAIVNPLPAFLLIGTYVFIGILSYAIPISFFGALRMYTIKYYYRRFYEAVVAGLSYVLFYTMIIESIALVIGLPIYMAISLILHFISNITS